MTEHIFEMQPEKSRWLNSFVGYYGRSCIDPVSLYHFISDNFTFTFKRSGSKFNLETCFWTLCDQVADFNVDECVETSCIFIWSNLPFNDSVNSHLFTRSMPNSMLNSFLVDFSLIHIPSIPVGLEKPGNHFSFEKVNAHHFQHWL